MNELIIEKTYACPYCGEQIDSFIDTSQGSQTTIEDCSVCCRPIELSIDVDQSNQEYYLTTKTDTE